MIRNLNVEIVIRALISCRSHGYKIKNFLYNLSIWLEKFTILIDSAGLAMQLERESF